VSLGALFAFLTHALEGHAALALDAAVAWGAVSVLLSPCHLASVPLLIGYISGQSDVTPRRAFTVSILFALGLLATIAVVGVGTAAAGRVAGDLGGYANGVVATVCLVAGLYLVDLLPASVARWTEPRWAGPGKGPALVLSTRACAMSVGVSTVLEQITKRRFPDYVMGLQMTVPLGNRAAEADYVCGALAPRQQEEIWERPVATAVSPGAGTRNPCE
jgi:cytochrome c biogenesis protein CcdA